jgi:hypothetical protein
VLPITTGFTWLAANFNNIAAALIVGAICIGLAWIATYRTKESFGKDLNYFETL